MTKLGLLYHCNEGDYMSGKSWSIFPNNEKDEIMGFGEKDEFR